MLVLENLTRSTFVLSLIWPGCILQVLVADHNSSDSLNFAQSWAHNFRFELLILDPDMVGMITKIVIVYQKFEFEPYNA